jgi:predicted RNA-binding protein with PUA-like domain
METKQQFWLMKSEPETYGIDHLAKEKKTAWTGVRNFQARNFMRDSMHIGDLVLFYHSNCKEPGIYGTAAVASLPYPDKTQFEKESPYFDARATKAKPLWYLVDIMFVKKLERPLLLSNIRATKSLRGMRILTPGNRLSITPVTKNEFAILALSMS